MSARQLAVATLAVVSVLTGMAPAFGGAASVSIAEPSVTSAGVYNEHGQLVRTLWSGRTQEAGPLQVEWDGRNDEGDSVAGGGYVARVLAHNVRYVWEGIVGNTSVDLTGTGFHKAFLPINDMAFDSSGNGFYVVGYNEGQHALHRFHALDPQRRTPLLREDYRRVFRYVATDGQRAYFANTGLVSERGSFMREPQTFVAATEISSNEASRFPAGVNADGATEKKWPSVIDFDRDDHDADGAYRSAPSGLAVQRRGRHLFVAHGGLNVIRVLDKHTGEMLGSVAASGAGDMDVGPDDSLWVLCRTGGQSTAVRYRQAGTAWTVDTLIPVGNAAAIGVSPVDGTVVVADADAEQLHAFDGSGRRLWTFGREGGYRSGGSAVANDRFWLSAGATYLAFQPDGSFWVGDPGNVRNLHFSADRRYLGQISYLPHSYVVAVDAANPGRVFRHFLEFSVDYSMPLARSWRLVSNWAAGIDQRYVGRFDGLQSVVTLRNGRTYGVIRRFDSSVNEIVELGKNGMRTTGIRLEPGEKLYADGSLRRHVIRFGALGIFARGLEGFDADGDPVWRAPAALARVASLKDTDPYYHDVPTVGGVNDPTYPSTGDGLVISFNPGRSAGFHLGAIRPGEDRWLWRASPSGSWELDAADQIASPDGRYEIGNGVQYPGSVVMATGTHVVYGYHGEAWRSGQANQWLHFLDNGLFVGQFGRPGLPGKGRDAPAGAAGNAFSPQLVSVDGHVYLWHNDEHAHAGIHRWRLEGADRIRVLEAPIRP